MVPEKKPGEVNFVMVGEKPKRKRKTVYRSRRRPEKGPRTEQETTKDSFKKRANQAYEYFEKLQKKGAKMETIVKGLYDNFDPRTVAKLLRDYNVKINTTLKNAYELRARAAELKQLSEAGEAALELQSEVVKGVIDYIKKMEQAVKIINPKFEIKSKIVRDILAGTVKNKKLTPEDVKDVIKEVNDILKQVTTKELIKGIRNTIDKGIARGKDTSPISIEAQKSLAFFESMYKTKKLEEMPFETLLSEAEKISSIFKEGKNEKSRLARIQRIVDYKTKGLVAEGLYKKVKGEELNSRKEIDDFLAKDRANRFVIIDGNLVYGAESSVNKFFNDVGDIPVYGSKGYTYSDIRTIARTKGKDWGDYIFSLNDNVITGLKKLAKGSPEIQSVVDPLIKQLPEIETNQEIDTRKLTDEILDIYDKSFGSKQKGIKVLDEVVTVKAKGENIPLTKGEVANFVIQQRHLNELAKWFESNGDFKTANDARNMVKTSGYDIKELEGIVKNTPGLNTFVEGMRKFYNEVASKEFEPIYEDVTGKPFEYPDYSPLSVERPEIDYAKEAQELDPTTGGVINRSAMVGRLRRRSDNYNTKLKVEDVRQVAGRYIEQMVHAKYMIPFAKQINLVLNKVTIPEAYRKLKKTGYDTLQENLRDIINFQTNEQYDQLFKILSGINQIGIRKSLYLNIPAALRQTVSSVYWLREVSRDFGADGLKDFRTAYVDILKNPESRQVAVDIIFSDYVSNRIKKQKLDPAIEKKYNEGKQNKNELVKNGKKLLDFIDKVLMGPISIMDAFGVLSGGVPYGIAGYKKYKTTPEGVFDPVAYKKAYNDFRRASSSVQQTSSKIYTSPIQRKKAGKLVMAYKSSQNLLANKIKQGYIDYTDPTKSKKEREQGAYDMLFYTFIGYGSYSMVANGLFGSLLSGDDKDTILRDAYETVFGILEGMADAVAWPIAILLDVVGNLIMGKPFAWGLPQFIGTSYELLVNVAPLIFKMLGGEDLSEYEKRKLFNFLGSGAKFAKAFTGKKEFEEYLDRIMGKYEYKPEVKPKKDKGFKEFDFTKGFDGEFKDFEEGETKTKRSRRQGYTPRKGRRNTQ